MSYIYSLSGTLLPIIACSDQQPLLNTDCGLCVCTNSRTSGHPTHSPPGMYMCLWSESRNPAAKVSQSPHTEQAPEGIALLVCKCTHPFADVIVLVYYKTTNNIVYIHVL